MFVDHSVDWAQSWAIYSCLLASLLARSSIAYLNFSYLINYLKVYLKAKEEHLFQLCLCYIFYIFVKIELKVGLQ